MLVEMWRNGRRGQAIHDGESWVLMPKVGEDAGCDLFASTVSQRPPRHKVTRAASSWFEQVFEGNEDV